MTQDCLCYRTYLVLRLLLLWDISCLNIAFVTGHVSWSFMCVLGLKEITLSVKNKLAFDYQIVNNSQTNNNQDFAARAYDSCPWLYFIGHQIYPIKSTNEGGGVSLAHQCSWFKWKSGFIKKGVIKPTKLT